MWTFCCCVLRASHIGSVWVFPYWGVVPLLILSCKYDFCVLLKWRLIDNHQSILVETLASGFCHAKFIFVRLWELLFSSCWWHLTPRWTHTQYSVTCRRCAAAKKILSFHDGTLKLWIYCLWKRFRTTRRKNITGIIIIIIFLSFHLKF